MPSSPASVVAGPHTRIDPAHGKVDAHSPAALKEAGNDAVRCGDWQRATHMYTLGIDMILSKRGASQRRQQIGTRRTPSRKGCCMCCCRIAHSPT